MLTVKRLGSLPTHSSRLSEGVVTCHVTSPVGRGASFPQLSKQKPSSLISC